MNTRSLGVSEHPSSSGETGWKTWIFLFSVCLTTHQPGMTISVCRLYVLSLHCLESSSVSQSSGVTSAVHNGCHASPLENSGLWVDNGRRWTASCKLQRTPSCSSEMLRETALERYQAVDVNLADDISDKLPSGGISRTGGHVSSTVHWNKSVRWSASPL